MPYFPRPVCEDVQAKSLERCQKEPRARARARTPTAAAAQRRGARACRESPAPSRRERDGHRAEEAKDGKRRRKPGRRQGGSSGGDRRDHVRAAAGALRAARSGPARLAPQVSAGSAHSRRCFISALGGPCRAGGPWLRSSVLV
ncbi:hypothetical protein AOLI_G00042820 [Acnodon oligacanthus]